jgi:hypothetical protein
MHVSRTAGTTLAALTIGIVVPLALGQPTTSEPTPAPGPAEVVVLEAFVTDTAGAPVPGLRAGDFELTEDGAPVAITGVLESRRARRGHAASGDLREPGILVVVFVDTDAPPPPHPGPDVLAGDSPWGAGARVLVASGGDLVTVRQPFTDDPQKVAQALRAVEAGAVPAGDGERAAGQAATPPADLASLLDSLGGLPGRKGLLYVRGALADRPAGAGSSAPADVVKSLADRANAAGVTLYWLDAAVAAGPRGAAAERAGGEPTPLHALLASTGGLAVEASAGVADAIARVVRDLEGAYSLSFAAPSQGDGAMHRLSVKVRRGGVSARARAAFRDLKDDERMSERTLAALLFGVADNPLAIQLSTTTEPNPKEGTQLVTVLVSIPLGNLAFAPKTVSHECDLALWLAARDGEGHVTRAPKTKFPVSVPNDRLLSALTQTAGYAFRVPFKAGAGTFAVTVRDEIAMQSATELTSVAPVAEPVREVTP